jgi:hypothetical protein
VESHNKVVLEDSCLFDLVSHAMFIMSLNIVKYISCKMHETIGANKKKSPSASSSELYVHIILQNAWQVYTGILVMSRMKWL